MRFAREGIPFIAGATFLAALGWTAWALGVGGLASQLLAPVLTVSALFTLWFFRNPMHPVPADPSLVVAPGQGKVIVVAEADEATYLGGRCRKISIFLSVFDVHVQRAPVSGAVEHLIYKPGAYAVAWLDKASDENEQASLGLKTAHGKILVRQIAGLIARRIITDPEVGQTVGRGDRIGLIRFGSRVDVFFPLEWEVLCQVGDRVVVGVTPLARLRSEGAS
ncbi:MAG TPA: phosphatidylserine decarboxylase family protein [Longimicrobiales bacterium]|nr:phosphatidylserine decarboxylase family protein [Longimicrobiales bacterium]